MLMSKKKWKISKKITFGMTNFRYFWSLQACFFNFYTLWQYFWMIFCHKKWHKKNMSHYMSFLTKCFKISRSANQKPVFITWKVEFHLPDEVDSNGYFDVSFMLIRLLHTKWDPFKSCQRRKKKSKKVKNRYLFDDKIS